MTNEAAERLRELEAHISGGLVGVRREWGRSPTDEQVAQYLTGYLAMHYPHGLDEAEARAAERRATVEQYEAVLSDIFAWSGTNIADLRQAILDAEADR